MLKKLKSVIFPRNENEKYKYLGDFYVCKTDKYYSIIMPIVKLMDRKARPRWCPRVFLRFLSVFGENNNRMQEMCKKLIKDYRFIGWKVDEKKHTIFISLYGDDEINFMVYQIEKNFYKEKLMLKC